MDVTVRLKAWACAADGGEQSTRLHGGNERNLQGKGLRISESHSRCHRHRIPRSLQMESIELIEIKVNIPDINLNMGRGPF